jgi:hypothetical protein
MFVCPAFCISELKPYACSFGLCTSYSACGIEDLQLMGYSLNSLIFVINDVQVTDKELDLKVTEVWNECEPRHYDSSSACFTLIFREQWKCTNVIEGLHAM